VQKDIETKFSIIRVTSKKREELARNTTYRSRIKERENLEELKHASEVAGSLERKRNLHHI